MIESYPVEKIYQEVAFIGYYMNWGHDEIMKLSHLDRIRWCNEISSINKELNDEPENMFHV